MSDLPTPGLDKTAVIITTFMRDELLFRCIASIRKLYPHVPIFVGDNGKPTTAKRLFCKSANAAYFELPFDLGVSGVRNETIKLVPPEYEYLMIVEDDIVFSEASRIEKLRDVLGHDPSVGLCGGMLILKTGREQHYEARVRVDGTTHYIEKVRAPEWQTTTAGTRFTYYDLILNVFLMRRAVWNDNPWDEQFKTALEHCDFFVGLQKRTRWKVAYTPDVKIRHMPETPRDYQKYRGRPVGWKLFGEKWGLKYVVSDYNAECPLSYEAIGNGETADIKGDNLRQAAAALDKLGVTWWLEAGTCLGAVRDKRFILHDHDIDIGIHPNDLDKAEAIRDALVGAGFELKREWRHKKELIEYAFIRNAVKLDIFFFRVASDDFWWHGAFGPNEKTGIWDDGSPFLPHIFSSYLFEKFDKVKLAEIECRVPSPPEQYLLQRYGPRWKLSNRAYLFWKDCHAVDRNFFKKKSKTVLIGGVFELLHVGHLNIFERAKKLGTKLVVGVLTDEAAMAYKPKPVVPYAERRRIIESLKCVSEVIEQHDSDPTKDLDKLGLKPHYIVHANDWDRCPGTEYVRRYGGKPIFFPYTKGVSTTELKERLKHQGPAPVRATNNPQLPKRPTGVDVPLRAGEVGVIVKTFLRDEVLFRNIGAIKASMPYKYRLYIADDGRPSDRKKAFYKTLLDEGHCVIELPFNSGISYGRNMAVRAINEEYVLLVDDDTHIRDKMSMQRLMACLDHDADLGLVSAVLKRERGGSFGPDSYSKGLAFEMRGELLVRLRATTPIRSFGDISYRYADQVPNVFLARRKVFDDVLWDNRIKVEYEHMDFFLQLKETKWKAGVCLGAEAVHLISRPDADYNQYRRSAPSAYFFSKYAIGNVSNQY